MPFGTEQGNKKKTTTIAETLSEIATCPIVSRSPANRQTINKQTNNKQRTRVSLTNHCHSPPQHVSETRQLIGLQAFRSRWRPLRRCSYDVMARSSIRPLQQDDKRSFYHFDLHEASSRSRAENMFPYAMSKYFHFFALKRSCAIAISITGHCLLPTLQRHSLAFMQRKRPNHF
jgi:hypothetical protein